jgi:hypothetical protein
MAVSGQREVANSKWVLFDDWIIRCTLGLSRNQPEKDSPQEVPTFTAARFAQLQVEGKGGAQRLAHP